MQPITTAMYLLPCTLFLVDFESGKTTYLIKRNPVNKVTGKVIIIAAMYGLMAILPR